MLVYRVLLDFQRFGAEKQTDEDDRDDMITMITIIDNDESR